MVKSILLPQPTLLPRSLCSISKLLYKLTSKTTKTYYVTLSSLDGGEMEKGGMVKKLSKKNHKRMLFESLRLIQLYKLVFTVDYLLLSAEMKHTILRSNDIGLSSQTKSSASYEFEIESPLM